MKLKNAVKTVTGTLAAIAKAVSIESCVYAITHYVKINGVIVPVTKIGLGYQGSYQFERAYKRVLSNFVEYTRFEIGTLTSSQVKAIETNLHNIAETTYFRESHESGKKSEKFHCEHEAAVNLINAYLNTLK